MDFTGLAQASVVLLAVAGAVFLLLRFFIRPRPPRVEVSSLVLWKMAAEGRVTRRLKEVLAVVAQVIALVLLAFALGQVLWGGSEGEIEELPAEVVLDTVHVVDTSLSMAARSPTGSRLAAVKQEIRAASAELRPGERLAVIDAGSPPRVVVPLSDDSRRIRASLRSLIPRPGGQNLESALEVAGALRDLRTTRSRVVVHSDDPIADTLDPDPALAIDPVGPPAQNLAIESFGLSSNAGLPAEHEAYVRVRNHGAVGASALLTVETPEAVLGRDTLRLEAGRTLERAYRFSPRSDPRIEVHLREIVFDDQSEDALELDNVGYVLVEPLSAPRVVLVSSGNRFLEAALRLIPGIRLDLLSPGDFSSSAVRGADLVFYDRVAPVDAPKGNAFYIAPAGPGSPAPVLGTIDKPALSSWNLLHPVLRDLHLDALQVATSTHYELGADDVVLIRGPDGVSCFAREHADGSRVIVWGFDFGSSDLPLRLAFPRLIFNSLLWAREFSAVQPAPGPTLSHGRAFDAWGPGLLELSIDEENKLPVLALGDGLRPTMLPGPGFWRGEFDDGRALTMAANLSDPSESTLAELPKAVSGAAFSRPSPDSPLEDEPLLLWPWLIAASLIFLLVETRLEAR